MNIEGVEEATWDDVIRMKEHYEPWNEKRLILDLAQEKERNLAMAVSYFSERNKDG